MNDKPNDNNTEPQDLNEDIQNQTTNDEQTTEETSVTYEDEPTDETENDSATERNGMPPHSDYDPTLMKDGITHHLSGMYQTWFLEYASYVILERAVPHLNDGLKPVQRRILHSMKRMDDGRYNKVANIVGHTMQFHPHGDASIYEALVQMGQKNLLIDCQGNWGNILTGDSAAAPRYIEARLSKFALDTVFNPKTTEWKLSYDGRNKEPITLPVKFPLLLAQGVEGIAVGLSSKILPHNFNEICEAAVSYLHNEPFALYPDFITGGAVDVARYNDGLRGGSVRVRAKIEKIDNKTLCVREIPFGKTVSTICDSIVKAIEKGKIKVRKVEDITAAEAGILIQLQPGASSDKTIDALYAFTDCETSISPNCCVIDERMPKFLTISDVLKKSVDNTKDLIRQELEIRRGELMENLFFASLEEIFIEERIYKAKEFEQAKNMDVVVAYVYKRLEPFFPQFYREVTRDDILHLMEIRMARILKFNKEKAEELMAKMKAEIEEINRDLANLIEVTANWFRYLKDKYGADYPRRTEVRNFDTIEAAKVAEANLKLYIDREEGFIGTSLKKNEFVCNCSDIDDVIIFYRDGTYKVVKIGEKLFVGETERSKAEKKKAEIIHVAIFKKNNTRTIYNVCYRDGKSNATFIKRFNIPSVTRDREYDLTSGEPKSRVTYFTANDNGEAEVIKVTLRPQLKLKKLTFEKDFKDIAIKGRSAKGNLLTKWTVHKILLKQQGGSTLGGLKLWFDTDVQRLNNDEHGTPLGEFHNGDLVLVVLPNGQYYTTNFDLNNHYETDLLVIEKFNPHKNWTAVLYDAEQEGKPYIKRFRFEPTNKRTSFIGENPDSKLILLTDTPYPRLELTFKEPDTFRGPLELDAEQFIAVKGLKAKGKRLTQYALDNVKELEPTRTPEEEETDGDNEIYDEDEGESTDTNNNGDKDKGNVSIDPDEGKSDDEIRDELTGQLRLF
ncbi:MAG: DNA gyrase/topoisomerase IV subunit A [Bacteroidaceae bacterium]|nr:DNA gyrase/topoisomerase IV subunit A [Bacteroidaceae bacterium]